MIPLLVEAGIKSAVLLLALLTATAYLTLLERRLLGRFQLRYGPNRAGPLGLLQPLADGVKLLFKESFVPAQVDPIVYWLAPAISMVAALFVYVVIPFGPAVVLFGRTIPLVLADVNVGILLVLAASSIGVYGIILGGWSASNKYSLLGALRSSAQLISYELTLGLGVIAVVLLAGSLSMVRIVEAQRELWFAFRFPYGTVAFLLFLVAGVAETNRAPFDLPEAEQELIAGYQTEYGGFKFAMFYIGEYMSVITISALVATLFLGGWYGPPLAGRWLPGPFWVILKILAGVFFFIWLRATLPRVRHDQLMALGWKVLLPAGFLNVLLAAVVVALRGA
ncbi:MAG: NADH-quinone oxidoreductase subunit NuoH [Armatimonadota bacterium]|nr:NADH-quinone oxidoreductase subunit NuoH [Armatimonadota bacterium]MDR7426236.1 NADH-quinone oxidoreductase subunit NuoH [Armatimonadota bacterium]MDR7465496.1 NADH-quinone oxidoreductase subunit NuoH [Armatimonadota bacterium]MDR7468987.1 NADH-quinone oxidoreductase subunit NuoH [Armatimonadota bacterium]MDR7474034.1 NADH-quinone oxidoreductase subunit NuoH [Armatimonadota bacterium]